MNTVIPDQLPSGSRHMHSRLKTRRGSLQDADVSSVGVPGERSGDYVPERSVTAGRVRVERRLLGG
jgi:hypothetical protein